MGSYTVNKQPLLHPRKLLTLTHMDQQVHGAQLPDMQRQQSSGFVLQPLKSSA